MAGPGIHIPPHGVGPSSPESTPPAIGAADDSSALIETMSKEDN